MGLHQAASCDIAPPRPTRHLLQQLKGSLRRARVAAGQPDIGIDDAHQRKAGKVMPFRHQLRADDQLEFAGGHGVELAPQAFGPARKIRGEHDAAHAREGDRRLLRQPLHARPADGQAVFRAAGLAALRRAFDMAAMVADERAPEAMLHQPGAAIGALPAVPAMAAERQRRISATVEEEQRLIAGGERRRCGLLQRLGNPAAGPRRMRLQIDGGKLGQLSPAEALRKPDMRIAPALGIDTAFHGWRRRGQHHRAAFDAPTHHGHVAGVVMHAVLLLVGLLVLLIDDDKAERHEGQEQGRACPDDHLGLARRNRPPQAILPVAGDARMPFRRPDTEALLEAGQKLRCQSDLRHEDHHLTPCPERHGHRLEVNLCLARTGDAFQQRHGKAPLADSIAEALRRRRLACVEVRHRKIGIRQGSHGFGRQRHGLHHLGIDQRIDNAGRDASEPRQVALRERKAALRRQNDAAARIRQLRRMVAGEPDAVAQLLRPRALGIVDRHARHHALGGERIGCDPVDKPAQMRRDGRPVMPCQHWLEVAATARRCIRIAVPDHPDRLARAERHRDEIARRQR